MSTVNRHAPDLAEQQAEINRLRACRDRILTLADERAAFRAALQAAIAEIARLARDLDRLREQHDRLRDEYPQHRERVMRADHGRQAA